MRILTRLSAFLVGGAVAFLGLAQEAGAREYDPKTGRFLQRDPIGIWRDRPNLGNGYTFVGNDPVSHRDPRGLDRIINNTGQPLLIWGNPGAGHGSGAFQYGVIPSDGKEYGGPDNPVPSYKNKQTALDQLKKLRAGRKNDCPPKPDDSIQDIDFYTDPFTGDEIQIHGDADVPVTTLSRPRPPPDPGSFLDAARRRSSEDKQAQVSKTGVLRSWWNYAMRIFE